MVDALARLPDSPAGLYGARAPDGIELWLPYQQGDVFRCSDVRLAGEQTDFHMLFMHPCTMRAGSTMREFQTVIAVRKKSTRRVMAQNELWSKNYKAMPLPDLLDDGKQTYFGDFMTLGTASLASLPRTQRVAQLSELGRGLLQQRLIFHLARYAPSLAVLAEATRAVQLELELQEEWVTGHLGTKPDHGSATICEIERLEEEFDKAISRPPDGEDVSVRELLRIENQVSHAVSVIQEMIAARSGIR